MFDIDNIHRRLNKLEKRIEEMTQQTDLDTVLTQIATGVNELVQKLNAATGTPTPPPPPVDLTAELDQAKAIADTINTALTPPDPSNNGGVTIQSGS